MQYILLSNISKILIITLNFIHRPKTTHVAQSFKRNVEYMNCEFCLRLSLYMILIIYTNDDGTIYLNIV